MNELKRCWSLALVVSAIVACSPNVVGGSGAAGAGGSGSMTSGVDGAGGGGTCPPPSPGLCAPSTACVDGNRQTGGASCENGQWVCETVSCDECVQTVQSCVGGTIVSSCCEPGEYCDNPSSYCDLGNGTCTDGSCVAYDAGTGGDSDGGAACSIGTIAASDYDQSCVTDTDCSPVYQGSLCSDCLCPNAAINSKDVSAYDAVLATHAGGSVCNCPAFPPPVCNAGVCTTP